MSIGCGQTFFKCHHIANALTLGATSKAMKISVIQKIVVWSAILGCNLVGVSACTDPMKVEHVLTLASENEVTAVKLFPRYQAPYDDKNLSNQPIIITEKEAIKKVLKSIQQMEQRHEPRAEPVIWGCVLEFDYTAAGYKKFGFTDYQLLVENTAKGIFFTKTQVAANTMTYSAPSLAKILEELAHKR